MGPLLKSDSTGPCEYAHSATAPHAGAIITVRPLELPLQALSCYVEYSSQPELPSAHCWPPRCKPQAAHRELCSEAWFCHSLLPGP